LLKNIGSTVSGGIAAISQETLPRITKKNSCEFAQSVAEVFLFPLKTVDPKYYM
jgi:hypothetical protein